MRLLLPLLLFVLFAAAIASPALSADGVLEINQTCAVQTGCFPGDTAGFPVTIIVAGSYQLTSILVPANPDTTAIIILASDVGIDLNGFSIIRAGCNSLGSCRVAGTGLGIQAVDARLRGLTVKNGGIIGAGNTGVLLGDLAEVSNVQARWNGSSGIAVGTDSIVSNCRAYENGNVGVLARDDAIISGSIVSSNAGEGVRTGSNAKISGNEVTSNEQIGIEALNNARISDNLVNGNRRGGINAFQNANISGNMVNDNGGDGIAASSNSLVSGNTLIGNGEDGVDVSGGSSVNGNTASANAGYQINLASPGNTSAYRANTVNDDALPKPLGTVNSGVNAGGNVCNGSLSCP